MTTAHDLLRDGDPDAALAALQDQVRAEPADAKHRVFLFQLLALLGSWDRALTQLNVAGELDAGTLGMVQLYRGAVQSEALRTEVFAGRRTPLIFGDPEQWIALLLEALRVSSDGAGGDSGRAQALRDEAFEAAPATAGRITSDSSGDQAFEWLADADTRLGPMLEAVINAQYYWVPIHRISSVVCEAPEDLRDLIWQPAQFTWANGGEAVGFLPVRYPGTENANDPRLRMARKTEWEEQGGVYCGIGQRILATDSEEYPLLDVRQIEFDSADTSEEPASAST